MKKLLSSLFILLLLATCAMAQERTVTGTVKGKDDGLPLPGVSVRVKGTTTGTQTGANGQFSIKVPGNNAVLVFTYIGYGTQENAVGARSVLNVTLSGDANQLTEVVVTALGLSRQQKAIGYAASTVKAEDLTAARNANAMSGVQGKVAGVSISNSGAPGGSTKVVIRGVSSFSGGNNPLYVVDGVPVNNNTLNNAFTGSTESQFSRSMDFGNQANDFNPEDIESMSILKGASATALYGSRAAHGVIMITTKRGKQNQKLNVTYTGAFNLSNVLRVPQTQNIFGQGWPYQAYEENGSWGPKFDGIVRDWGTEVNGVRRQKPYSYVEDNIRDFYDTGSDIQNSVTISGGGDHNSLMFSYSNTTQNGVVPTDADKYARNNFSLRGNSDYGKFKADYSVNYIRRDMNAVFSGQGTSDGGATLYQELIQIPVDIPISQLKDYKNVYNNVDNYFTAYAENPYFIVNENGSRLQDDRIFGKLELSYEVFKNTRAIGRLGGDFNNTKLKDWGALVNFTPGSFSTVWEKAPTVGRYGENFRKDGQIDANLLLQGDYKLNEDISLGGVVGYNYNQRKYEFLNSYVSGLNVPNWYSLQNKSTSEPISESLINRRRLMAVFGSLDFGFKDYWFANVSLRNDWSSTLPKNNRSYFYWGANTSFVFTDAFKDLQSEKLSYLKVRAAWGQTGNDADPYRVGTPFIPSKPALPFGDIYTPLQGVLGLTQSNNLGNENLKPEITTEWELGLDTRWINSRIGLDFSYYNRKTKDQIVRASIAPEAGFTTQTLNIGNIQNKGFEALLTLIPVKTKDFQWTFVTNFTKNKSKVLKLYGNAKEIVIENAYSIDYVARVGEPLGIYRVPKIRRVESGPDAGKIIVGSNGYESIDPNDKEDYGSSNPDFILGFNNNLKYKNFSLGLTIDWRKGGQMYSYTKQLNAFVGNTMETTYNMRQPFVVPNSVREVTTNGVTSYVENNIQISTTGMYSYWYGNTNQARYRDYIIDRDYLKLREVVLTYSLPKSLVSKARLSNVDVSLIGRNLLMFTPKSNTFVDPEGTNYGNDIASEFGEFAAGPTMRSIGASLRVTF
ncbi:SusC/RagA family TonB-linked outer membrane protein [Pararcticibacter amylolyticus]|uniref:SusC/RagA family TonB-linked outer membrane protein n=1 Tax=Pararcticibacter amylolyticus TaxID=2173175 RepID=A0A2U2PMP3_9SPHI|nr:SusC/RagA family TonB-linked outer membrane protein [Pararcticibacter amylolyticus]PWG82667.1 SusC/RagA family TonB-linked outer membrane protein [Pararcticibacter amylolyticus]